MMRGASLVLALLGVTHVHACTSDTDCNLNGLCKSGSCVCDVPWKGDACGALDMRPALGPHGDAYGVTPNVTSWGGNVVYFEDKYHLFVAEMVEGCGLGTWTTNSQVTHATASDVMGPYTKQDTALVPWAHNPQIVLQQRLGAAPRFVLWHIGNGDGSKGRIQNCTHAAQEQQDTTLGGDVEQLGGGSLVHVADRPEGPWTAVKLPFGCNNPSPMWVEDAQRWYAFCNDGGRPIMTSPSLEKGPWTQHSTVPSHNAPGVAWEDPYLYIDARKNWHAIAHAYNHTQPCGACASPLVSGHWFSADAGKTWHESSAQPYSHEVTFDDGTSHVFSTRERPKFLFDGGKGSSGTPTHLLNGVNPMTTCPPVNSVNCKCKAGVDWDYTLIQPLATKATTAAAAQQPAKAKAKAQPHYFEHAYQNPALPVAERVSDLMSKMTLDEKIAQTIAKNGAKNVKDVGKVGFIALAEKTTTPAATRVAQRNTVQKNAINASRWGIPISFTHESLHGGCAGAAVFPMPLTLASAWNASLVAEVYAAVARDTRACGANVAFAPVINLFRDPRFGRFQEGFAPDPVLTAHLARAAVQGLQGSTTGNATSYLPSSTDTVISLAKHFAGYGGAAGGLNAAPLIAGERTLRDVYLRPWRAFAEAGGRGAMPAHQTVLDTPCHANEWLINEVFRKELGFGEGLTISDCNDVNVLMDYYIAANVSHAAAKGLIAGVDVDLQCGANVNAYTYNTTNVARALADGTLPSEDAVNAAARHALTSKIASRLLDSPMTDPTACSHFDSAADRALARAAAAQGLVLLKNAMSKGGGKGGATLPLAAGKLKRVAVVGQLGGVAAAARQATLGSYTSDDGSIEVPTFVEALTSKVPVGGHLTYVAGASPDDTSPAPSDLAAAAAAAAAADVAIAVVGDSLHVCGEWDDRSDLDLAGGQLALLRAVANATAKSGTPLVVVLIGGRPATFGAADGNAVLASVDALLWAGRPGEEGANAIVDVLLGDVNPGGKLTANWPRSVGQVHSGSAPFLAARRGKWIANVRTPVDPDGRRYDSYVQDPNAANPLFYFGSGLSYTTFAFLGLQVRRGAAGSGVAATVDVDVHNSGGVAGSTVVQVYARDPIGASNVVRPWKRLVGFLRTASIARGASARVTIDVTAEDLSVHDDDMAFRVVPGDYMISVGDSSNTDTLQQALLIA